MALAYNIEKDIRYNQSLEKGMEKASTERNQAVTANLLRHTDLSNEKISELVGAPLDFVVLLRKQIVD